MDKAPCPDHLAALERVRSLFPEAEAEGPCALRIRGEEGVLVSLTWNGLRIATSYVHWEGPRSPRLSAEPWRDLDEPHALGDEALRRFVEEGLAARAASYRPCRRCARRVPPERRMHNDTCHPCAERWDGVVF